MHHFFFYANQTWPLYLPFSPTSCSFPKKDNMVQNTIIYLSVYKIMPNLSRCPLAFLCHGPKRLNATFIRYSSYEQLFSGKTPSLLLQKAYAFFTITAKRDCLFFETQDNDLTLRNTHFNLENHPRLTISESSPGC